jgi:predicted O-methyltransferase YrrM
MDSDFPSAMLPEIEEFLSKDSERESGLDLYPGVFDTQHFFPLQRKEELKKMIQTARKVEPKVIMEIGADKGGGLYHWCKCFPSVERIIGCEIRGTPYSSLFERSFPNVNFLWLPVSSYDNKTLNAVHRWLGEERPDRLKIDVLFCDGEKSYFKKDIDAYLPFMSPKGVMFLHDITDWDGPPQAFEYAQSLGFRTETIIDKSDTMQSLGRAIQGQAATTPYESWLRHWAGTSCGVGVVWMRESQFTVNERKFRDE